MTVVLAFGSVDQGRLAAVSLESVGLASTLAGASDTVKGVLLGDALDHAASEFSIAGMSELYVVEDHRLGDYAGGYRVAAAEAAVLAGNGDILVVPADADSIEWAACLAARLGIAIVTSCLEARIVDDALIVRRAIAGGSLQATYRIRPARAILLIVPGSFSQGATSSGCKVTRLEPPAVDIDIELLGSASSDVNGEGPPLKTARVVVAGGSGVATAAQWKLLEEAAGTLGAAVGASRAAVEMGLAPAHRQVGFSALKVAPDLYIAVGISGALHHLAGIGAAKKIVAINKDSEAPIFQASHLGVVGDLTEILPAFITRLQELKLE